MFITEIDIFRKGQAIYLFDRCCITSEGAMPFDDKLHIIYVNGQIQDNTPLGLLMHDFHCTNPDDMHYEILANRVRYFKEDEEGVAAMCKAMEDMRNEAILQDRKKLALQRLEENELSHEQIAKFYNLEKILEKKMFCGGECPRKILVS